MAACVVEPQGRSSNYTSTPLPWTSQLTIKATEEYENKSFISGRLSQNESPKWFKVRNRFYMAEAIIGRGKYGRVYACYEVKLSTKKLDVNGNKIFGNSSHRQFMTDLMIPISPRKRVAVKKSEHYDCYKTEYSILYICRNHPLIVAMYDGLSLSSHQLMVTELLVGGDLFQLAFRILDRRMRPAEAWFYLAECSEAIAYLHENSVVHQDVKSDNILLDSRGHIRLADYGLAIYRLPLGERCAGQLISQSRHMPPEIVLSNPRSKIPGDNLTVWHAVDWFSLGVMIYRLMYQAYPYEGQSPEELRVAYKKTKLRFPETVGEVPPLIMQDLLCGMLDPDPEIRIGGMSIRGFEEVLWHSAIRLHPQLRSSVDVAELRQKIRKCVLRPPFAPMKIDMNANEPRENNSIHMED